MSSKGLTDLVEEMQDENIFKMILLNPELVNLVISETDRANN